MTNLAEGAARVIAGDITAVFHATDTALLTGARVAASVLEGTADSGMHPRTKQRLLEKLSLGYGKMLEGRNDLAKHTARWSSLHAKAISTLWISAAGVHRRRSSPRPKDIKHPKWALRFERGWLQSGVTSP